ncbi:MAG: aminomethyl-transferring glycine dehydrogenase subunit GcvPA [Thermoplasmata archaeon]|nr:aminomethyl-transferring glycine dehydrogenase subunit GcvPA [Thermoplasmata archaeon]
MARWIPYEPAEEARLLGELGISSTEELFADIPRSVRLGRLGIGAGKEEPEVAAFLERMLGRNRSYRGFSTFLGGRTPIRYVPAAVDAILSRSEFYTAYTPYQPEASQGMLQALFEFQSLWVELTGLDAANASLYDGATAAGEAMLLSRRLHEGHRFLVPASLPWEERSVLENYGVGAGVRVEPIPYEPASGRLDLVSLRSSLAAGDVCGMLAEMPNGLGGVDDQLPELKALLSDIPLTVLADPLALTVLEPPGNWGADIVVAEGQGFGLAPSFGGPLLGLLACRREHLRLSPGRIVGATTDREQRRAFTLTLQTREQHIRRSRATSNICTNQSLLALAFVAYASLVGPRGLERLAANLSEKARTLASQLSQVTGLRAPQFDAPYLWEFAVSLQAPSVPNFLQRLRRARVLGGSPLADPRAGGGAGLAGSYLASVHEGTTDRDIARYVRAARAATEGAS